MADKPDLKADTKQEAKLADPLNIERLEAEAAMRELGKRAIPIDTKLPAAFSVGGKFDFEAEVRAQAGETYSSIASNLLADRDGRRASKTEVHIMATAIAEYNGKTGDQANNLAVNELVRLPPLRKAV